MPITVKLTDGRTVQFPDGTSQAEMEAALSQVPPMEPAASHDQQRPPSTPMGGMLPTAGSLVGSTLGTLGGIPGRIAGAGIGGALGKGAELFMDEKDDSLLDSLQQMGTAGASQAALEGAGGLLGKGLKAGAGRLYQSVLKPSKGIREEYPTVVQDAIAARIPVGHRGAAKAERLVGEAAQKTTDKLALMERAGVKPVTMRPVVGELRRTTEKVSRQPLREVDLQTVRGIRDQALKENPGPIPITRANQMKQAAQRQASEGYRKIDRGADINSVPLDANMDIARGLRQAIERRVPQVAELNERTQRLGGVNRAIDAALGRIENTNPVGMNALIASGVGAAGAGLASGDTHVGGGTGLAILALTNPAIASRLAIGANRAAPLASHAPNAGRLAALLAALGGPDQ